jgi:hypothetical protein
MDELRWTIGEMIRHPDTPKEEKDKLVLTLLLMTKHHEPIKEFSEALKRIFPNKDQEARAKAKANRAAASNLMEIPDDPDL